MLSLKSLASSSVLFASAALLFACSNNPPAESPDAMSDDGADMADEDTPGDVVSIAAGNDDFSTLVAAVEAAGLVETLQGEGPFTVFAPTNDAFAALPEGTVEALLKPENKEQLVAVLTYHVVPGKMMAADVVGASSLTSVEGTEIPLEVAGDAVMVKNATVTATDIEASNGVIHVIDSVILPE